MTAIRLRTRYAPSPTGFLHVGGARSALFGYLFAKANDGDFVVRIEDTDLERNVVGGTESQVHNLEWLGIVPDESPLHGGKYGPYKTSGRIERHVYWAKRLVAEGKAYECFCSPEQLEKDRELAEKNHTTPRYNRRCFHLSEKQRDELRQTITPAIRLKIDDNHVYEWDDLVHGKIGFPGNALSDPIILRSTGLPTYNYAVTVDDFDMAMTHVLRGEEHIANTPYQLAV